MRFAISSLLSIFASGLILVNGVTAASHRTGNSFQAADVAPKGHRMTNAERLARNLPPLKPKAFRRGHGTRADSAPRSATSVLPPIPYACNILVKDAQSGSVLGYMQRADNGDAGGAFGYVQPNQAGALEITFSASPNSLSNELNIHMENPPHSGLPWLGGSVRLDSITFDSNLGASDSSYMILDGVIVTGRPGSIAVQTAIWIFDPSTGGITAQWINTDGSLPDTYIVYTSTNSMFALTGSISAVRTVDPSLFPVTFTCVTPVSAPTAP